MSPRYGNPEYAFWQEVIEGLAPRMAAAGFKRRHATWYRYNRQVLQLVDVRLGDRNLGLRLGLVVRRLDRSTHPSYDDCHIGAGIQWLLPRRDELEFDAARNLCASHRSAAITTSAFWSCIRHHAVPILDSTKTLAGIRALLASRLAGRFWFDKALTKIVLLRDGRSVGEN